VPRGFTPLPYTKDLADRTKAGLELKNPVELSDAALVRGKVLYERFCLQCHGPAGDGQGHLYTSKLYPFPPASLINEKVSNIPDGEIFHTVTYGFGVMPEHASIIPVEDRWLVIHYIRKYLQKK
jgi:mono/diheme cytochrome c family protein